VTVAVYVAVSTPQVSVLATKLNLKKVSLATELNNTAQFAPAKHTLLCVCSFVDTPKTLNTTSFSFVNPDGVDGLEL
jgi:hypothetical protein